MAKTKRCSRSRAGNGIWLFLFLVGALATYAMPFISIRISGMGKVSYSFADIAKFLPKPKISTRSQEPDIDFMKLIRKILPQRRGASPSKLPFKLSAQILLAVMVPVALGLAYFLTGLGLLLAMAGADKLLGKVLFVALLASSYAASGGYVISVLVQKNLELQIHGFFGWLGGTVAKAAAIQGEYGVYLLVVFIAIAFLTICWKGR